MTQEQFRALRAHGKINVVIPQFENNLKSDTDPTQDVPVRAIQFLSDGVPLNVKKMNYPFNGFKTIDNLSAIEKRNMDKFDALGELQATERKVATDIYNYKQLKQKENEN